MSLPGEASSEQLKKDETYAEYLEQERLTRLAFNSLQVFVAELLLKSLTPAALRSTVDVSQ